MLSGVFRRAGPSGPYKFADRSANLKREGDGEGEKRIWKERETHMCPRLGVCRAEDCVTHMWFVYVSERARQCDIS